MKVSVEPRPLVEPLAGGSAGATVAVEPLIAGHATFPETMMVRPEGRFLKAKVLRALLSGKPEYVVPVPAFLVRHPTVGAILVDTGLHPSIASDGRENFGAISNRFGKPELKQGEDVPAQLRDRGLEPAEIAVVVMTHLHLDHSSAISEFPDSTFVVSAPEWRSATTEGELMNGYRRRHFDYAFEYRTVDFDQVDVNSYGGFARTFDLFGDGSVRLAFTPGHSAGHISVVCRLSAHDFVIGGDAVYMEGQLDGTKAPPPRPYDSHNWRRSMQELRQFRRQFPGAVVTPGHDPEFYSRIDRRYE